MPLTQGDLADVLGLTPLHVNRVLKELRDSRLLEFQKDTVTIFDLKELIGFADFNKLYLHQDPKL